MITRWKEKEKEKIGQSGKREARQKKLTETRTTEITIRESHGEICIPLSRS